MKNAQRPDKTALGGLLREIKDGRYVIPDFQREFEWKPKDIRELIKSIFLDYYIGSLLLWKGKDESFTDLCCEPIYGLSSSKKQEYIVLDGQQRLTAMFYAFVAPDINFPKRKSRCLFYVRMDKFIDEQYDEAFMYEWLTKKWLKISENSEEQYKRHIFPMSLIGEGDRAVIKWLDGYKDYWQEQLDHALNESKEIDDVEKQLEFKEFVSLLERYIKNSQEFDEFIHELGRDYQISYIELNEEIGVDKVCDIFTQINSRGVRLDIFDLLNAMLRPKNIQLKEMWRIASQDLEFPESSKMNVYVLQVMSILLQSYCSSNYLYYLLPGTPKQIRLPSGEKDKIVLVADSEEFTEKWNSAVSSLEKSIKILRNPRDYGAIISAFTPYPSMLPIFSAIRSYVESEKNLNQKSVKNKIRKWYWASIFNNRYSSSVESTSAKDFGDLKNWFFNDDYEPDFIASLPDVIGALDLKKEVQKGSAIYKAMFNMYIIKGAKDFITDDYPEYDDIDDHHIVPASWGRDVVGQDINSVLNRTPLTPDTNGNVLRGDLPNIYLKEMFVSSKNKDDVYDALESHFISKNAVNILLREDFKEKDYYEFIEERKKSLIQGIYDFLISDEVKIEPKRRHLDDDIEEIELSLRQVIIETIGEDPSVLPQHISQKAKERITRMVDRDATKNMSDYQTLSALIEFFDFRELEDMIMSKALREQFSNFVGQKEVFKIKISQLAELRNSIRHSRSLDDVVVKEGEAAIIWFKKLLMLS